MSDAIREPTKDMQDGMVVFSRCGKDVADICAVKDAFEGREDADPYRGPVFW